MQISHLLHLGTNFIAEVLKTKVPQSVSDILIRFKLTKSTEISLKMDAKLECNIKGSQVIKDVKKQKIGNNFSLKDKLK